MANEKKQENIKEILSQLRLIQQSLYGDDVSVRSSILERLDALELNASEFEKNSDAIISDLNSIKTQLTLILGTFTGYGETCDIVKRNVEPSYNSYIKKFISDPDSPYQRMLVAVQRYQKKYGPLPIRR
jgi:hypothetical protein